MKVYAYVIATDSGAAPNFEPPMPTLAICKPKVRLGAEPGNLVIAFTGRQISPEPHGVCWAGLVSGKQTFADYWADPQFASKKPDISKTPDNIYKPTGRGLIQVPNDSHGQDNAGRDLGGQYALAFKPAWYFGSVAPVLPTEFGLRLIGGRRGHRVVELSNEKWRRLEKWLNNQSAEIQVVYPATPTSPSLRQKPRECS